MDIQAVLATYAKPVPRYTSYPTAPHFRTGSASLLKDQLIEQIAPDARVSLYLHIPFCDRLCWFCGCHTKHTTKYAPVHQYVRALIEEIAQFGDQISFKPLAGHVHFGGGSPSLLNTKDMAAIRKALDNVFKIDPETEISVELDPSDSNPDMFGALEALGVTRISIGVQDFHPDVQRAINRPQSYECTKALIDALRARGIQNINIDALYGLPLQTGDRLKDTIEKCIALKPSRMALFGYAHVPWVKKHQKLIQEDSLPSSIDRFHHATAAAAQLEAAGYQTIGIDHFALPDDDLAKAASAGQLKRNFQGYTVDKCDTLIGFGCSSISRFTGGYIQNIVATGQYESAVHAGQSTAAKGCHLSDDDTLRGHIIERLMCDMQVDFAAIEQHFGKDALLREDTAIMLANNDPFGLVTYKNRVLSMNVGARLATRIIASYFDAYYAASEFRFSKAI